jgi:isopenicillin N synthase-like dioxygenase
MNAVPTIDLSNINAETLQQIDTACRDHGFFKLVGHGLNDLLDEMWNQSERFFETPLDFKYALMRPADSAFGYFNREMTKLKRDQKETFDYNGLDPDHSSGAMKNRWPDSSGNQPDQYRLADFENTLKEFYAANAALAEKTLGLVLQALGEDANDLNDLFGDQHTTLARLNHYPSYDPLPSTEHTADNALGDMALHEHTDPGAITLLYQDEVGGLQTYSKQHGWIDVEPEPYSFVVNLGDLMQVWSNDHYQAAKHRVLSVPADSSRYSMPFFYTPRYDAVIEPVVSNETSRYTNFTWLEFAIARMEDNYENLGKPDTQVTDWRIGDETSASAV